MVRWTENGRRHRQTFGTYEAACAFVRDYVSPYKDQAALPPSAIAPAKGPGWTYVFRSAGPGQPVKIGWSTDPGKRMKYLSTGHPYRIDLVALLPSDRGLERRLHQYLDEYRLNGEWFSREAEVVVTRLLSSIAASDDGRIALPSQRPDPAVQDFSAED